MTLDLLLLFSLPLLISPLLGLRGAGSSAWGFFSHMLLLHLPARLPCSSGYFSEGGAPIFSSILLTLRVPGLLPLWLPTQSHLGGRSFRMLCASLLCPLLGGLFRLSALGLPCLLPFSPSVGLGVCTQLLSILIPASSFSGLCPLRSLLLLPRHAYHVVRGLLQVGRFPWMVRCWLLRVPCSPSFSSVFLCGFLWPSKSPAGPGLPFPYPIWVLYPVGSSPSARVFPLWLFLFYHRVDVLWFLLSLQALVSQSTFACLSRVCSLSHALPPSLAAPFLRTVCSFFWGYVILMAWVLVPS